MGGKMKIK